MLISKRHHIRFILLLLAVLCLGLGASLACGAISLSFSQLFSLFTSDADAQTQLIVFELRLPRALLTMSIGALLACSGAVMQGLFRNPLADPSLIGVTAGASLGASLVIFLGLSFAVSTPLFTLMQVPVTVIGASVCGALSVYLIYRLSTRGNITSVVTMLLGGIALSALVGGINNLMLFFADSDTLRRMSLWRMGSLEGATMSAAILSLGVCGVCVALLTSYSQTLNAFLLGESEARHLGVNVERAKKVFICVVAIATGFSVAFAGTIAFVGLIIPHMIRIFIGPDHRLLLPASAIAGAILLLLADILARTVIAPTELPVGLLTALIGAPFFIVLLLRPKQLSLG